MKKTGMILVSIASAASLSATSALAQFDDNDFAPPPPLPGSPSGGGFDNPGNRPLDTGNSSSATDGDSSSILSKSKKEKIAQASIDEINNKNFPELIDSFDYNNAELTDVIKAIGELTGKNFIYDSTVRGKITIVAPTKITVAEAYKAFLSALAFNGFTVVPGDGFYKIKQSRAAQKDNIETYSGSYYPISDQMITRIIHLKHISAEMVNRELRAMYSKEGDIQTFSSTNSLIISDYGSNVDRITKILNQLDVPGFEEKLFVQRVKNAKAKDMAELINKIVNKDTGTQNRGAGGGGSFSAGVPRFGGNTARGGAQSQSGTSYFMVIPDERTNSLIIVGNQPGIERVKKLVAQLDFRIKADENGGVYVYYVRNGEAEKIAQTLTGIAKDTKTPSSGSTGGGLGGPMGSFSPPPVPPTSIFGGDIKVTADKETNSLIVTASRQDYEVVLGLLSKIDIARNQVYIEAIILEMVVKDDANWGLGYYQFNKESGGLGRVGFNGGINMMDILNPVAGTGAILSFGSKDTFEIRNPVSGQPVKIASLVGFLNFLKSNNQTNILSTPQIMALDNEESTIEVGREVAVGFTQQNSMQGTQQTMPQYKDATTKLKIKPFISPASDDVRLKIEQTINEAEAGDLKDTMSIAKRNINTNIVVPNGDTAVLGGLMKDSETVQIMKVPILGDIPILGWLFKSRSVKKVKNNLLVFLTPKIIRNAKDNKDIVDKKLDERLSFIKQNGGRDPYGKKIDQLPRQAKIPGGKANGAGNLSPESMESEPPIDEGLEDLHEEPKLNLTPEELDGRVVE